MKTQSKKFISILLICCIAFVYSISIPAAEQNVYAAGKIQLNQKSDRKPKGESGRKKGWQGNDHCKGR